MNIKQTVFIVDDDEGVRDGLALLLESIDQSYELFSSALDFLEQYDNKKRGCLVLDIRMPQMSGLDLQKRLKKQQASLPIIFISGHGDIPMAVEAMRQGALDFIRKPFREHDLLDRINEALSLSFSESVHKDISDLQHKLDKIATLSEREFDIFNRISKGDMNKIIAADLGISERTVEVHRSQVMKKIGVRTLAQLVRIKIETELLV
jgi:FixJ family two-component response regulator